MNIVLNSTEVFFVCLLDADAAATTLSRSNTCVENLALEPEGEHKKRDKAWIQSLSWDESRRVVRNFLISATAKDCGLMITLRPLRNSHGTPFPVPSASLVTCPTTGQQYICKVRNLTVRFSFLSSSQQVYRFIFTVIINASSCFQIAFLDLDTKRLKKMPFHYEVDKEIVDTYKAFVQ